MGKKRIEDVLFIVTLADGSEHRMRIDVFTLRSGDHIARVIASERQTAGQLQKGKIVDVRRARPGE